DPDPETPDRTYSNQVAVISGWEFDATEFQVPPVVVDVTDTTHWLALSTPRTALANAQVHLDSVDRPRTGVMLGDSLGGEWGRSTYLRYRWPYVERAFREACAKISPGQRRQKERLLAELKRRFLSPIPSVTEDTLAGTMSNTIAGRICGYFDFKGGG